MNKKQIFLILCLFMVFVSAISIAFAANDTADSAVSMSFNDAPVVQATDVQEDTLTVDSGSFTQLKDKIQNAPVNGSITLENNYTYSSGEQVGTNGIVIDKDITIDGGGHTIDGANIASIFQIKDNAHVILKNIVFRNAQGTYGSAISFSSNENVLIINSQFINNSAVNGGAIYIASADTSSLTFSLTIVGSTFINNRAENGGAIYAGGTFTNISSSTFKYNTAAKDGGSIYLDSGAHIDGSIFEHETAGNDGGAIYFNGKVDSSSIDPNIIGELGLFNNNMSFCNASNYGGAVYFDNGGIVTKCNFADNFANLGGAIYSKQLTSVADTCIFKTSSDTNYNINILPPTLNVSNFTTFYGSGEKLTFDLKTNSGIPLTDENISIRVYFNNHTHVCDYSLLSSEGWLVDLPVGSYYAIFNTTYVGFEPINRTIKIAPKNTFVELNHIINAKDHQVINLTEDFYFDPVYDADLANGILIDRPVTINGNGYTINANGKARIFKVTHEGVVLNNISFINGNIAGDGGAVQFDVRGNVTNCNFTGNNATSKGGAVCCYAVCFVTNCNFINNNATSGNGGALWSNAAKVENCNFTGNSVLHHGGAVWIYLGNVSGCDFTANEAISGNGGALKFTEEGNVRDCTFTNNSAMNAGAVAFNGMGDLTNCKFNNNRATSYHAGAAYFYLNANVINCSFTDNGAVNYGGAILFDGNANVANCDFVNNKVASRDGGAVYFNSSGVLSNCNFTGNSAEMRGGAVYFYRNATVDNCNFTGNSAANGGAIYASPMCYGLVYGCDFAKNSAFNGGAVNMYDGIIENCNFANNHATNAGGAVIFSADGRLAYCNFEGNTASVGGAISMFSGNLENCNFTGNNATRGSAINFNGFSHTNISDSLFLNNRANASADNPLNVTVNGNTVVISFIGLNNLLNAIYSKGNISFTNVTYWGVRGIENTGADPLILSPSNCEAGQSISVIGVVNGNVINATRITDENGRIVLGYGSDYYLVLRHDADSYYTQAETISTNMKPYVNIASLTTSNMTVNITAKSNIYSEVMPGELIFILPNRNVTANYSSNGIWWTVYTFADYVAYDVNAYYIGLDNVTVSNATIDVKVKTELTADEVTVTYNINKDLVITLKDGSGNSLTGFTVSVDLNGVKTFTTDSNGQVKVSTAGLVPKTYVVRIVFAGIERYHESSVDVKVIINKATPKITAKKKTFKKSKKAKKYRIVLKSNVGKGIGKVQVTLKIGKKTYKAKTNSKGKATFKIKKLTKGKYKTTVKFAGNANYNAVTKKVKITIK